MRRARVVMLRLWSLFRQEQVDRELGAELQYHLERQVQENLARGMTPDEARFAALRAFGGTAQVAEQCRDARRVSALLDLARDIRYACRVLARNRLFAAVAIGTLAVGIGATTAIFGVVNAVLLQPLPYPDADRIVSLGTRSTDTGRETPRLTGGDVIDLHASGDAFDGVSTFWGGEIGVQSAGRAEFAGVFWVEPSFFRIFSVAGAPGRTFTSADGEQAAVVGSGFAQRMFGSPTLAVGKTLRVEDQAYQVVGVLPAGFAAPRRTDVWLPIPMPLPRIAMNRTAFNFEAVARLARGASLERSRAQVEAVGGRLALAFPDSNRNRSFSVVPLRERLVASTRSTLYVLLGAVLLVLLVACVNVANLLLARATTRSHEIALRAALGAGRWRIVRQLAAESVVLALIGGALGVSVAYAGTGALLQLAPADLPRLSEVSIDWRVLLFASGCSLLASLLFGLAPAWQASQVDPQDGLHSSGTRGTVGARSARMRAALVVGEIALSFALAVSGGLLFRSFIALTRSDLGFRPGSVLVVTAHRPARAQQEYVRVARFFSEIAQEFSAIPGVQAVGVTMGLPTGPYGSNGYYSVEGRAADHSSQRPHANFGLASPGYFGALGMRVLRGRDFGDGDTYDSPFVAIINEALARDVFAGEDPVGHRVRCGLDAPDTWMTIVGVVGDVRQDSPASPRQAQLYMPLQQHPYYANEVQVVLRSAVPPTSLIPAVRARMQQLTPDTALKFATLEDMVGASIGTPRFRTYLVGGFATLALLLAMAGVYGVTAYLTARRTSEFGLRIALGAGQREIFSLVLGRAARLAVVGLVVGVVLSLACGRLVASLLFGLEPLDGLTYAIAIALVGLISSAAAAVPAWHAARIDPLTALRQE